MKFWQTRRAKQSVDQPTNSEDLFDPAIWKDKQEILQRFTISARTLQRWREHKLVGMKKYKRKFFYNIHDANRLFDSEQADIEEPQLSWPYSYLWTAVVGIDIVLWIMSEDLLEAILYMAVPLFIAVPAQIIMSVQKSRGRKKD
jgi:hypothetical protein